MSRFKLLVSNIFFFGGLKVFSSLLPFILLPYVTKRLNGASEFGLYDLFILITSFGSAIGMMGVQDALFREFHSSESEGERRKITRTGFVLIVSISFFVGVFLLTAFSVFPNDLLSDELTLTFIGLSALKIFLLNASKISLIPSRLVNSKKHISLHAFLKGTLYYAFVIGLLEVGLTLKALIYGQILTSFVLIIVFVIINRHSIFPVTFSFPIAKSLLKIGIPLMPIFIIYWVNNSIVRLLIIKYLGVDDLGIFAIGHRYANISTFIQMAFSTGWAYFTYSTMNDKDQMHIKSKVFEFLLFVIAVSYALIAPFAPWFFTYFFEGDYQQGHIVFGQLFLGPLFLILYQIIANQFTIKRKSYISLVCLSIGAFLGIGAGIVLLEKGYGILELSYIVPGSYIVAIFVAAIFASRLKAFILPRKSYLTLLGIVIINLILRTSYPLMIAGVVLLLFLINAPIIKETIVLAKSKYTKNGK